MSLQYSLGLRKTERWTGSFAVHRFIAYKVHVLLVKEISRTRRSVN